MLLGIVALLGKLGRDIDNVGLDTVGGEVLLGMQMTLAPLAGGRIGTKEKHAHRGHNNDDEGYDERYSPCHVIRIMRMRD